MNTTNERPTPETDALQAQEWKPNWAAHARRLERERDEAREALENHKAQSIHSCHDKCKRPMCVLRHERDEARAESLEQSRLLGMSGEREAKLLAQLAVERALADRLAGVLFGCTARDQNDAYDAWKEARND